MSIPRESAFLTPLRIQGLRKKKWWHKKCWKVIEDFHYYSEILGAEVVVKADSISDFASTPRIPGLYAIAGDVAHEAAVLHDDLYANHIVDRKTSDRIFLEAMYVMGTPLFLRRIMYRGVRIGGWNSYRTGPKRREKNRALYLGQT